MKNRSKQLYLMLMTLALLVFSSGCEQNTVNGPIAQSPNARLEGPVTFVELEPTATAIYKTGMVQPSSGAALKIKGQNINDGEFSVKGGNVSAPTEMTLIKLSETSNTYHLLPADMELPEGVEITLMYDHSAMPFGVVVDDLHVFRLTASDTIALESQVKLNKMEVNAEAHMSGEFSLGAYDGSGKLHLIEGEFGIRQEESINHRKGGIIRLGGGSALNIPKFALDERTTIAVIASRETVRGKSNSKSFTFTPHGTEFNIPVELVLSWKELAGEPVILYYFNEYTQEWEVNAEGVWDEDNNTVTLLLNHFSRYALAHG